MKGTVRKKCSRCKKFKPVSEYSVCKTGKYGLYNYCKPCHKADALERNPNRQEIDEREAKKTGLKKLGLKRCTSCKNVVPLEDFYGDPRHKDGKQSHCKQCWLFKANKTHLSNNFGITFEEYKKMMDAQDGCCAICKRASKRNLSVDHSHTSHKIRGLLCTNCNAALLPQIEAHPEWVNRALEYLANPPAVNVIGEREVPVDSKYRKVMAGAPIIKFGS